MRSFDKSVTPVDKSSNEHVGRVFGYARVSTVEQNLDMQVQALIKAGVPEDRITTEKLSAASKRRPGLELLMAKLGDGDEVVVWKLDRLARSLPDLIDKVKYMTARGTKLRSLTEGIDTRTAMGNLLLHVLGSVAQFERDLTVERTKAGIANRRRLGHPVGRKREVDVLAAEEMIRNGSSVVEVADAQGCSDKAIRRYFPKAELERLRRLGPKRTRKRTKGK